MINLPCSRIFVYIECLSLMQFKLRLVASKRSYHIWHKAVFNLERFSFECRKTKTKVITLANHKEHRQYSEPIKKLEVITCS